MGSGSINNYAYVNTVNIDGVFDDLDSTIEFSAGMLKPEIWDIKMKHTETNTSIDRRTVQVTLTAYDSEGNAHARTYYSGGSDISQVFLPRVWHIKECPSEILETIDCIVGKEIEVPLTSFS
jgi:hypothetical protein